MRQIGGDRDRRRAAARSRWRAARRRRATKRLVHAVSAAAAALTIVVLSIEPYEWMIGAQEPGRVVTRCDLLALRDPARPLLAALLLVPVVVLLIGAWRHPRSRLCLLLSSALAVLWLYRFHLRFAAC